MYLFKHFFSLVVLYVLLINVSSTRRRPLDLRVNSEEWKKGDPKLDKIFAEGFQERRYYDYERNLTKVFRQLTFKFNRMFFKKKQQNGNVLFSPIGTFGNMIISILGTEGNTTAEYRKAFQFPEHLPDEVLAPSIVLYSLKMFLQELKNSTLMANARENDETFIKVPLHIFVARRYRVKQPFADFIRRMFNASVTGLEFYRRPHDAYTHINKFFSESTNGKIPQLIPGPINASTKVIFASSVMFRAEWEDVCRKEFSRKETFYTSTGNFTVDMMGLNKYVLYLKLPKINAHAITLPLKHNPFTFTIVMSYDNSTISQLIKSFSPMHLHSIYKYSKYKRIQVTMPKLNITWSGNCKREMKKINIKTCFGPEAETDWMFIFTRHTIFFNQYLQACFIETNEQGINVEGNKEIIESEASPIEPDLRFNVNKEFIFYIEHPQTNALIYFGTITRPFL